MTPELFALAVIAVFAASMWIPFIVGVNTSAPGSKADLRSKDFTRPADPSLQCPWVHRAYRAHLNLLEQAMPFAILILLIHATGVTSTVTIWAAWIFVALRGAHAVGMITGTAGLPARPLIFTGGWLCCVALFVELLRLA